MLEAPGECEARDGRPRVLERRVLHIPEFDAPGAEEQPLYGEIGAIGNQSALAGDSRVNFLTFDTPKRDSLSANLHLYLGCDF